MYALPVVTCSLTLMYHSLCFPPHIQRILPLFIVVLLLLLYLLMFCILLSQTLLPLSLILYSLLNLHSCSNYTHLRNHYIFLGTLLTLRSVVGKTLSWPLRTVLRNALSLIILGMHILLFFLFSNRIPQIIQILPPLITHNESVQPHNRSILTSFPLSLLVVYL